MEPTADQRAIKKAYIALIKQYPPEDHGGKLQEIRAAYEQALQRADQQTEEESLTV